MKRLLLASMCALVAATLLLASAGLSAQRRGAVRRVAVRRAAIVKANSDDSALTLYLRS